MYALLLMLLLLAVGRDVDSKPSHNTNGDDPFKTIIKKCISDDNVGIVLNRCTQGLEELIVAGFPWLSWTLETPKRRRSNRSFRRPWEGTTGHPAYNQGGVSDPMDSLNHVCQLFERISSCMDEHKTPVSCILAGPHNSFVLYKAFEFLWQQQRQQQQ